LVFHFWATLYVHRRVLHGRLSAAAIRLGGRQYFTALMTFASKPRGRPPATKT